MATPAPVRIREARAGLCFAVDEIAVGLEVERQLVGVAAEHESALVAQRVPDAQFIENVNVMDREVGDNKVGRQQPPEHVDANVAPFR
jgi:hypothetical protein